VDWTTKNPTQCTTEVSKGGKNKEKVSREGVHVPKVGSTKCGRGKRAKIFCRKGKEKNGHLTKK